MTRVRWLVRAFLFGVISHYTAFFDLGLPTSTLCETQGLCCWMWAFVRLWSGPRTLARRAATQMGAGPGDSWRGSVPDEPVRHPVCARDAERVGPQLSASLELLQALHGLRSRELGWR